MYIEVRVIFCLRFKLEGVLEVCSVGFFFCGCFLVVVGYCDCLIFCLGLCRWIIVVGGVGFMWGGGEGFLENGDV